MNGRKASSIEQGRPTTRLGVWLLALALVPAAAAAQDPNCVPSCEADDGRFLVITDGVGLDTLTDTTLDLQIRSPGGGYSLGFFDGETSGFNGLWDINASGSVPQLTFNLFADPNGDGAGTTLLASFDGEAMADNAWTDFAVADDAAALSPGGEYVYLLQAELTGILNPGLRTLFKVRTEADVLIEVFQQPFSFTAALAGFTELSIIYPGCAADMSNFPGCLADGTTYDGDFRFFLTVNTDVQELVVWDGDLDRGDWDGANPDGNDFNTLPGFEGLPPWACQDPTRPCTADGGSNPRLASVNFEGIATGEGLSTGSPPDDFDPATYGGVGEIWLREGPVRYEVWGPDGLLATNNDPSGNREWEKFRLAVGDIPDENGMPPDAIVAELPAGIYEIRVKNLDLENLNAFRFGAPATTQPDCDDGRANGLEFIYTGDSCDDPEASNNSQGGLPGTSGDYQCSGPLDDDGPGGPPSVRLVPVKKPHLFTVTPSGLIEPGGRVTVRTLTSNSKLYPNSQFELQDDLGNVLQTVTLHTSCSQPLIVGEQFGSLKLFTYFLKF